MLIERYGCLGGLMTGGLVTTILKVDDGINGELISRLRLVNGVAFYKDGEPRVDPEFTKWIMDEMLQSENVKLLFYTFAASVLLEGGNTIKAVIIENKSGRQAIEASVIVDATGDGDIAALSGVSFLMGDRKGRTRPVSSMFLIQDVAKNTPENEFDGKGQVPEIGEGEYTGLRDGEMYCWAGRIQDASGLDPEELTQAEISIRKKACEWMIHARKDKPGYKNAFISQIAPQVGVRETRRIIGLYILKKQDWKDKITFKDSIGITWGGVIIGFNEIPFGCLIPKKIRNLAVVGRCGSYKGDIFDDMRGVTACISTGQAGGVAAALACRENVSLEKLDIMLLRNELHNQGVNCSVRDK